MNLERTPFPAWAERMEQGRRLQAYHDGSPNPYAHHCRPDCPCDGRRSRTHSDVDIFVWLVFGLSALAAWWRWG